MVTRRLPELILVATLSGCASSGTPTSSDTQIDSIVSYLSTDRAALRTFERATNSAITNGFETGGFICLRNGRPIIQQIRNEFLNTINYLSQFRISNYQHADEFIDLLERSRSVHVENNNANIVSDIDEAIGIVKAEKFSKSALARLDEVCRQSVLPHTYCADRELGNSIMSWHSHPNGFGPSNRDRSNSESRPSLIVPYKTGKTEFYFLFKGKECEHIEVPELDEEYVKLSALMRR